MNNAGGVQISQRPENLARNTSSLFFRVLPSAHRETPVAFPLNGIEKFSILAKLHHQLNLFVGFKDTQELDNEFVAMHFTENSHSSRWLPTRNR